jgi:hypothetical protein
MMAGLAKATATPAATGVLEIIPEAFFVRETCICHSPFIIKITTRHD